MWHDVLGAGRSRVRRHFFGLSDAELDQCRDVLSRELEKRVAQVNG